MKNELPNEPEFHAGIVDARTLQRPPAVCTFVKGW
jgi:hypothetical protein